MRREEEAFLSTFITILQQGTFVSPSLSRLEVQITRGLQKSNDFGGVDIKQQRRRVLQPSLLSSEEFVMQSHSFHCFKKRVEGLRPKPPKVSISIIFCYKSKFTSKQKTRS